MWIWAEYSPFDSVLMEYTGRGLEISHLAPSRSRSFYWIKG